ncbi:acetyltransferase GNAT family protein [Catovirus CTV1]|uniref:Acetyltransferase GNAT family protein n=1 Tax=Catovirus CTV1 TaxID=1977631 RepID=A0A1V0SBE9_9VIRU|nr:acetyltransferase GNAT family protein [Catovirus CTV1]
MNNINIISVDSDYFNNKKNTPLFVDTVFNNFSYLAKEEKLKHSFAEINKLLNSPKFKGFFIKKNNHIIGYLLGEIMNLDDGRKVYYISYLYVSHLFRKHGFASKLLSIVIDLTKNLGLNAVMLICDTENNEVHDFYAKRGFMLDMKLRRYEKHDVFSLPVGYY